MRYFFLFFFALPQFLFSQSKTYVSDDPAYIRSIDAADELFEAGNYREAIPYYEAALQVTEEAYRSKYRLATCFLKTRAFAQADPWLQKCAEQHPEDFCENVLDEDAELYSARPFLQWASLQTVCNDAMPRYDYRLKIEMEEIHHFDQFIRSEHRLPTAEDCVKTKWYSPGMSFMQVDSVNQVRIRKIIDALGEYPGPRFAGKKQGSTAWLVIQHAPIEMQEKYYPLVEKAMQEGQVSKGNWAYLVDRMRMNRGEKQVYGSQMRLKKEPGATEYEIYPLEDPFNVNQRRAAVGLGPIEEYISGWGVKFEPEKMRK
jgi:tetratricopeptide (TPR) repeat protein